MQRRFRVLVGCECSGRVRDAFAALGWEAWSADILPSETPVGREFCSSALLAGKYGKSPVDEDIEGRYHYQGDVLDLFNWNHKVNEHRSVRERRWEIGRTHKPPLWDLFIGHPPCTDLSYAGARWFKLKDSRRGGDGRMQQAANFFIELTKVPSPLWALENPHSIIQTWREVGMPTQVVQPWWFGDPFEKQIHLWLRGLPPLQAERTASQYPGLLTRVTTGGGSWRTDKAAARKAMSAYEDSEGRANRAKVRSRTMPGLARAMAEQWAAFAEKYYDRDWSV